MYEEAGFSPERAAGHLDGIDFAHPVTLETLQPGKVFEQQMLGGNKGNYFTEVGTAPETVGINPAGRVPGSFTPTEPVQALRSTAAPIVDTWTTPGQPYQTMGGGTQLFVPNKALMVPVQAGGGMGVGSTTAAPWSAPRNWQGPSQQKGTWSGEIGNSDFILNNTTAKSVGLPIGSSLKFTNGAVDFSPHAVRTPAGTPGSFSVDGLVYKHVADASTTVKHLANEAGMSPAAVRNWLATNDVRMHHFQGNTMQLVPTRLHTGIHHTGSRALGQ